MLAVLEVTVEIDEDQLEELESQGEKSYAEIQKRIEKSIILTPSNMRQPVFDIEEVRLMKYKG